MVGFAYFRVNPQDSFKKHYILDAKVNLIFKKIYPLPLFIFSLVWQQDKPRVGGRSRNESRSVVSNSF